RKTRRLLPLHAEIVAEQAARVTVAAETRAATASRFSIRIPVRRKEEIVVLLVAQITSIVAEGELLHLATVRGERYTITYRLKDLEARLDPARFLRLGRG